MRWPWESIRKKVHVYTRRQSIPTPVSRQFSESIFRPTAVRFELTRVTPIDFKSIALTTRPSCHRQPHPRLTTSQNCIPLSHPDSFSCPLTPPNNLFKSIDYFCLKASALPRIEVYQIFALTHFLVD